MLLWLALTTAILLGGPAAYGAPQLDALRVASAGDDNATPLLYAMKAGLFTKAGLE